MSTIVANIKAMFDAVNIDCAQSGGSVVPLTSANVEYYEEQLENLEYTPKAIEQFTTWLATQ